MHIARHRMPSLCKASAARNGSSGGDTAQQCWRLCSDERLHITEITHSSQLADDSTEILWREAVFRLLQCDDGVHRRTQAVGSKDASPSGMTTTTGKESTTQLTALGLRASMCVGARREAPHECSQFARRSACWPPEPFC